MKKLTLLLAVLFVFAASNAVYADNFDSLEGLSVEQKLKLTQIYNDYKVENNDLETKIMDYTDKIARIRTDKDKTPEQVSLLTGAYERNIQTLRSQQRVLEKTTNELYKQVMTPEQFQQYSAQQIQAQNAFSNFLQK